MFSAVGTALFCLRNGGKTTNGDIGRAPVTVAQGASVIKALGQTNSTAAKPVQVVLNAFQEIAESDKFFNGLSKTVKFASENVNPLIVASSGLKVALAKKEDRKKTIIAESGCLAGMFLGEGWMKNNLTGLLDKLPVNKKWLPIIKGVTFVLGSITASTIGQKIGQKVAQYWDTPLSKEARERKEQQAASNAQIYKNIDYKA